MRRISIALAVVVAALLLQGTTAFAVEQNVAPLGTASQSTDGFGGTPERAIDGNTSGLWAAGSITHTGPGDPTPSWQVDLGEEFTLVRVVLWNRTDDCCSNRLTDFRVRVINAAATEVFTGDFFTDQTFPVPNFEIVLPAPTIGQTVRVERLGLDTDDGLWLSLAEVQVFADIPEPPTNLALFGQASQSTTDFGGLAERAIDGNTNGDFGAGSVTHSANEPGAFWEVGLFCASTVDTIVVWARTACCPERLANIRVSVRDNNGNEVWGVDLFTDLAPPPARNEIDVPDGIIGRFVRVQRIGPDSAGNNFLSLAEVEVFGDGPLPAPIEDLTTGATASQSTLQGAFFPALALDGNFGNFTHTLVDDPNPTWEANLGSELQIGTIILHNRGDGCCQSRLRDITVAILDAAGTDVRYESPLLNAENVLGGGGEAGPPSLTVDLVAETGSAVLGQIVRVTRTRDDDLSGTGGLGNNGEPGVLSLGEVEILGSPQGTNPDMQAAGDCSQDGLRNIIDVVCYIRLLFPGFVLATEGEQSPPCTTPEGNIAILDTNGDAALDVSDLVLVGHSLFGGPPPIQGTLLCICVDTALGCGNTCP